MRCLWVACRTAFAVLLHVFGLLRALLGVTWGPQGSNLIRDSSLFGRHLYVLICWRLPGLPQEAPGTTTALDFSWFYQIFDSFFGYFLITWRPKSKREEPKIPSILPSFWNTFGERSPGTVQATGDAVTLIRHGGENAEGHWIITVLLTVSLAQAGLGSTLFI